MSAAISAAARCYRACNGWASPHYSAIREIVSAVHAGQTSFHACCQPFLIWRTADESSHGFFKGLFTKNDTSDIIYRSWSRDYFLKVLVSTTFVIFSHNKRTLDSFFKTGQDLTYRDVTKLPVHCLIYLLTSLLWLDVKLPASNAISILFPIWFNLLLLCRVRN